MYPPVSKGSREVANLTERKNLYPPSPVYSAKENRCSVPGSYALISLPSCTMFYCKFTGCCD